MSIRSPEGNDHSSTPEGNDQYRYGGHYFHLRDLLMRGQRFTTKAYLPNHGGVFTVTNIGTSNGGARIVLANNRMKEPDESDPIYFDEEFLHMMGIPRGRLKVREIEDEMTVEKSGIYPAIDKDVLERIMKEPPLDQKKEEKKAG
jgi:hypothetical protein